MHATTINHSHHESLDSGAHHGGAADVKLSVVDKVGSVTMRLGLGRVLAVSGAKRAAQSGDVVIVQALTTSATYNQLELPSGRLAKINVGDTLVGALGNRRALKGFVGDVPASLAAGERLHLLNMGGVMGRCTGHHSSLSDAIELEVIGFACDESGAIKNIADAALPCVSTLGDCAPVVMIAGACMNSGKTVAATEIIRQATHNGMRVAAGKLSGVACLRDTLNMADHGAIETASFLDCGLPSTVGLESLAPVAKGIIKHLNQCQPDVIVIECGDGILGGYSVDTVLDDVQMRAATKALVFCAGDYVGAWGGIELLKKRGLRVDVIAGSVTDSQMGEDYIEREFQVPAGNARRDGARLFKLINDKIK